MLRLSAHEMHLLRTSWKLVLTENESHCPIFCCQLYHNLTNEHPDFRAMFPTIQHQAAALSGVITVALGSLENLLVLEDYLHAIGHRHYRVLSIEPEHFQMMSDALVQTFADRLGDKFTNEVEYLWQQLYAYLANTILESYEQDSQVIDPDWFNEPEIETQVSQSTTSDTMMDSFSTCSTETSVTMHKKPSLVSLGTELTKLSSGVQKEDKPFRKFQKLFNIRLAH